MTIVVGVDLAGKTTGRTAVATAEGRLEPGSGPTFEVRPAPGMTTRPDVLGLADQIAELEPDVVAVDAPLSLPHQVVCTEGGCRRCHGEEADGSYTLRAAERVTAWREIGHLPRPPMPTSMIASLAFRAIYLRRLLEARSLEVIETWPAGVLYALGGQSQAAAKGKDRHNDAYVTWARWILVTAGFPVPASVQTTDDVDAIAAAVTAWEYLRGQVVGVGDEERRIWVPDPRRVDR